MAGGSLSTGAESSFRLRGVVGHVSNGKDALNPQNQNFMGPQFSLFQKWARPLGRQYDDAPGRFTLGKESFSRYNLEQTATRGYFGKLEGHEGFEFDARSGRMEPYYRAETQVGKRFRFRSPEKTST